MPLGNKHETGVEASKFCYTYAYRFIGAEVRGSISMIRRSRKTLSTYQYRIENGRVKYRLGSSRLTAPFSSFNNAREQGNVVREDGTIYYPFVGSVQAAGRTALEIRDELAVRLAEFMRARSLMFGLLPIDRSVSCGGRRFATGVSRSQTCH